MLIPMTLLGGGLFLLCRTQHNLRRRWGLPRLAHHRRVALRSAGWLAILAAWPLAAAAVGWSLGTLYWIAAAGLLGLALVLLQALHSPTRSLAHDKPFPAPPGPASDSPQ